VPACPSLTRCRLRSAILAALASNAGSRGMGNPSTSSAHATLTPRVAGVGAAGVAEGHERVEDFFNPRGLGVLELPGQIGSA
jgi:hypothetical protein